MKRETWLLAGIGLASGLINAGLTLGRFGNGDFLYVIFFAGVPFGLVTGLYFSWRALSYRVLRYIGWVVVSGVSYAAAVQATTNTSMGRDLGIPGPPDAFNFALGGFVGAVILVVGARLIFAQRIIPRGVYVCVAGAALPALLILVMGTLNSLFNFIDVLYIVWQTIITVLLGFSYSTSTYATKK